MSDKCDRCGAQLGTGVCPYCYPVPATSQPIPMPENRDSLIRRHCEGPDIGDAPASPAVEGAKGAYRVQMRHDQFVIVGKDDLAVDSALDFEIATLQAELLNTVHSAAFAAGIAAERERCCKAVCENCADGLIPTLETKPPLVMAGERYYHHFKSGGYRTCDADPIRRIASAEREAK